VILGDLYEQQFVVGLDARLEQLVKYFPDSLGGCRLILAVRRDLLHHLVKSN